MPKCEEWIKCSNEMPKVGQRAIVYRTGYPPFCAAYYDDIDAWTGVASTHAKNEITHWMPLPEPPAA